MYGKKEYRVSNYIYIYTHTHQNIFFEFHISLNKINQIFKILI